MDHEERMKACLTVSRKLLERHPDEVIATAVAGSVARNEDREHSDIDFHVIVKEGAKLKTHKFLVNGCFFIVVVKTENDWLAELRSPNCNLAFIVGALQTTSAIHDPTDAFARLRGIASTLPDRSWKDAVTEGFLDIVEDLGRVRDFFADGDSAGFRMWAPLVAFQMGAIQANLKKVPVVTERAVLDIWTRTQAPAEARIRFEKAIRLADTTDEETMEALEWLLAYLTKASGDALPQSQKNAEGYSPPDPG